MRLKMKLKRDGWADGDYQVKAKGCLVVSLHWATAQGALPGWTAFAYIPVSADGAGNFRYEGERGIPMEATHVLARGVSADFADIEEWLEPIPGRGADAKEISPGEKKAARGLDAKITVMSDLHLTRKNERFSHLVNRLSDTDCLLLAGDLVNDGMPEQYHRLKECLEAASDVPICCTAGNHDFPLYPLPMTAMGEVYDYPSLQTWLAGRNESLGYSCEQDPCGTSAVQVNGVDIITLNAASHWRRFVFHRGEQLEWLQNHMKNSQARRHVILCHAPLLAHNPQRKAGSKEAYLSRDARLQEIIDEHRGILFLSGHTHISPNLYEGCVEYDEQRQNLYINCGSICPTELKGRELPAPNEWKDGNIVEILLRGDEVRISMKTIHGKSIARGYYQYKCKSSDSSIFLTKNGQEASDGQNC